MQMSMNTVPEIPPYTKLLTLDIKKHLTNICSLSDYNIAEHLFGVNTFFENFSNFFLFLVNNWLNINLPFFKQYYRKLYAYENIDMKLKGENENE